MGVCYTVIMQDELDWSYVDTSKEKELLKFEKEFKKVYFKPDRLGEWYGAVVYDIDKANPEIKEFGDVILKYCDFARYYNDIEPWKMENLEAKAKL